MTPAIRVLDAAGVDYGLHEYDRSDQLRSFGREAAAELGLDEDEVFKTLLVDVDGGTLAAPQTIVVVVPVSCSVSMKAAAGAVGAKRAVMCDPAVAERRTGYVVGGISPLGQKQRLTTVVDESASLFERVFVSGGRRGLDVSLDPAVLIEILDAVVADVTA